MEIVYKNEITHEDANAIRASVGFRVSTPEQRGTPMQNCLTDHIELTDSMFGQ